MTMKDYRSLTYNLERAPGRTSTVSRPRDGQSRNFSEGMLLRFSFPTVNADMFLS